MQNSRRGLYGYGSIVSKRLSTDICHKKTNFVCQLYTCKNEGYILIHFFLYSIIFTYSLMIPCETLKRSQSELSPFCMFLAL